MAAIDKIYGTREQRRELKRFLMRHRKRTWLKYLYPVKSQRWTDGVAAISNFPTEIDHWLWRRCQLAWVRERLAYQYGWEVATDPTTTVDEVRK